VSPPRSLATALADAGATGLERLDAQWLLGHLLAKPRGWLIAHDGDLLDGETDRRYAALCARRAAGEPLAYLVGEREFHGLALQVSPAVLIPRPDTETLVDWALALLAQPPLCDPATPAVLDLGTGSGAIALAVKQACPRCQLSATDRSADALDQAQANAARLGLPTTFLAGDWWDAVPDQQFELVLSNPPYIAAGDPHLAALRHEPLQALTPGGDGLDAIRQIVAGATAHLRPPGWLLLEHGWDQAAAVRALLQDAGFDEVQSRRDLAGHERCTGGRLAALPR